MKEPHEDYQDRKRGVMRLILACMTLSAGLLLAQPRGNSGEWTFYVTSDTCPDYTWGLSEKDTRTALAELVRANLDEMTRTDAQPAASRHHYNMAVTQEALIFLERYPERKDELIRRVKEGPALFAAN